MIYDFDKFSPGDFIIFPNNDLWPRGGCTELRFFLFWSYKNQVFHFTLDMRLRKTIEKRHSMDINQRNIKN